MVLKPSQLVNFIGTRVMPFMNPRVVCPPGIPVAQGRPNIIVATPKRSGTHVLIDTILNNIPAYRNTPLYIDLDQCWKKSTRTHDLISQIAPNSGYVIKTHLPIAIGPSTKVHPHILSLFRAGTVITVRRDRQDISRSLQRWDPQSDASVFNSEYDAFWAFWADYSCLDVAFDDLFIPNQMQRVLDALCSQTGTARARKFIPPTPASQQCRIYANKALTRIFGRRTPRVDTTIHTLKG